jgi:hypothetical protein
MEKFKKLIEKWNNNTYWIFILSIYGIYGLIEFVIKTFKTMILDNVSHNTLTSVDYWQAIGALMQIITVYILYVVCKKYKIAEFNIKQSNEHWYNEITRVSSELTLNINKVNKSAILYVSYVHFYHLYKDLEINEFTKKLAENYSKEDLEELGLPKQLIDINKDVLLPRNVFEKYNDFQIELQKYKLEQNNK